MDVLQSRSVALSDCHSQFRVWRGQPWPLHDIATTNIVWCMEYNKGVGGGGRVSRNTRAIVLKWCGQCRLGGQQNDD